MKNNFHITKIIVSIILLGLVLPIYSSALNIPAGFTKDLLWFSKDPFFVGDNININTFVFNSSQYRMTGTMILRDGTSTVDKRTFIVESGGDSKVISFPYIVTPGTHSFSAFIERDEFVQGTSSLASSSLLTNETVKVKRFADYDKNQNGIGDSIEPPPPPIPVKSTTTKQISTDSIKVLSETLIDETPTPVLSVALPILGTVESIRVSQGTKAIKNLKNVEQVIQGKQNTSTNTPTINSGSKASIGWNILGNSITSGQITHSPFDYLRLFLALVTHFFTTNSLAFYLLILLILYKIAKVVIGLFT